MTQKISIKQKGMESAIVYFQTLLFPLLGSMFLALMAQLAIPLPFTPVPISLQTLGISLLAISLGSRSAPLAVMAYLFQAAIGWPVLAGGVSNPFWILGPRAGYLIAFIAASYFTAKLIEKQQPSSFFKTWIILSVNEGMILFFGSAWLALFVGWESALSMGIFPFLSGAVVKITIAAAAFKPIEWAKFRLKAMD